MSSEERFRRARDLIAQNYSTNQISKILKISERSVTRFKRRMREERKRLKSEGRIPINSEDDDDKFKHLKPEEKIRKAHELFKKNLKIPEIAEILKISERSVRRWKDRLEKYKDCDFDIAQECQEEDAPYEFEEIEEQSPPRKKKKFTVDREKVDYARELIENKLSNKDMSLLLEMSIACVRKLKTKILNGSVEELIDNNEEYYRNLELMNSGDIIDPENDPLQSTETYFTGKSTIPIKPERKPKVLLRESKLELLYLISNIT
jgi:transposase